MSSNSTSRRQVHIPDVRQLLTPTQLEEGMSIGLVTIYEGAGRGERLAQALASLSGVIGDQSEGRLKAAKKGWNHIGLKGLFPEWRGRFDRVREQGYAQITLLGKPTDPHDISEWLDVDPADLPDLETPIQLITAISSLGLTAIHQVRNDVGLTPQTPNVGRWEQAVTLNLS